MGALVAAMGLIPILAAVGIIPSPESSFHAPRWVVAVAGLAFMLAGLAVALQGLGAGSATHPGARPRRPSAAVAALQYFVGLAILGGLAAIFDWVAFGPGPRQCGGALSLPFISLSGPASEWSCRAVFSVGAMLGNIFFVWGAAHGVGQLRRGGREIRR